MSLSYRPDLFLGLIDISPAIGRGGRPLKAAHTSLSLWSSLVSARQTDSSDSEQSSVAS